MTEDLLWYKDAIVYEVHIKAFFDSTDDGIGDFAGLMSKLDYIQDLGVTAIWLLPFYPSPLRDDGYDIADFRNVNPAYGTVGDFRRFVREAHRRGLKVITELVVNHTSDQHGWFQRARRAKPGSAWRDYYVWSDTDNRYNDTRIIFTDTEASNWAWDPVANAYYWHRFFSHQPDLNFDNPQVVNAILRVMQFWLDMGVDGLRLDAVPYLCEREGTNNENLPETHAVIRRIRAALDERYSGRMLLAEANQWPEDVLPYFSDGDECHMAFHFPLMPRFYMALALEDRHPITDIIRQTPDIPEPCQWAVFLRNHDELTLEMVTDRERDYLWSHYAGDPRMRINLGIRRRLAPLLDNDRRKIELLNSLLMSMPGTPIVYYGDEIGMGDNIYLGDRDGVRTPMQWSPDRNAGFSRADPAQLYLPPIMDAVYGYEAINVEAQSRSSSSLLNWMKRLLKARQAEPAFGRGTLTFLMPGNRTVLAYLREYGDDIVLCVANLSRAPQPVELDLARFKGRVPVELLGQSAFPPVGDLPYFITLPPHGFYWFRLQEETKAPVWHEAFAPAMPDFTTLVVPRIWDDVVTGRALAALQGRILPDFIAGQRWFAGKGVTITGASLRAYVRLGAPQGGWLLAVIRLVLSDGDTQDYQLPLAIFWDEVGEDPLVRFLSFTLARVRRERTIGVLCDAVADEAFTRNVLSMIAAGEGREAHPGGRLAFRATRAFRGQAVPDDLPVQRIGQEQSNSSLLIGDRFVLKLFRRLQRGIHPEVEMGRYLTEVAGYANTPALLGAVELIDGAGQPTALGVLHEAVRNQGDGWAHSRAYLDRMLDDPALAAAGTPDMEVELHANHRALVAVMGLRVGELHRALCGGRGGAAFRIEPVSRRDLASWRQSARRQARQAMTALRLARRSVGADLREPIDELLACRNELNARIDSLVPDAVDAAKTRLHGDLHLGQFLVHQNDVYIIDFEGEPARPLARRRRKDSPLKDVAGMLRSFDYAAWSAVLEHAGARPDLRDALLPWALDWKAQMSAAFLDGYREAIDGCPSYPARGAQARTLIDLFMLEKALYEICYEAANRPDWLRIPIQGVRGILRRVS